MSRVARDSSASLGMTVGEVLIHLSCGRSPDRATPTTARSPIPTGRMQTPPAATRPREHHNRLRNPLSIANGPSLPGGSLFAVRGLPRLGYWPAHISIDEARFGVHERSSCPTPKAWQPPAARLSLQFGSFHSKPSAFRYARAKRRMPERTWFQAKRTDLPQTSAPLAHATLRAVRRSPDRRSSRGIRASRLICSRHVGWPGPRRGYPAPFHGTCCIRQRKRRE